MSEMGIDISAFLQLMNDQQKIGHCPTCTCHLHNSKGTQDVQRIDSILRAHQRKNEVVEVPYLSSNLAFPDMLNMSAGRTNDRPNFDDIFKLP